MSLPQYNGNYIARIGIGILIVVLALIAMVASLKYLLSLFGPTPVWSVYAVAVTAIILALMSVALWKLAFPEVTTEIKGN